MPPVDPTLSQSSSDQIGNLVDKPPTPIDSESNPVHSDGDEEKLSDTESDSGLTCAFPGQCSAHPTQPPTESVNGPNTAVRVQGLVTTTRAPTTITRTYEVIELE